MRVIDTFSTILDCFVGSKFNLARWENYSSSISPELVEKLKSDTADYDFENDILPVLNNVPNNSDKLIIAHQSFVSLTAGLSEKVQALLQTDLDVSVIFYLGLCNGAGWATQLEGMPVVLLGAEKIIELSWHNTTDMAGLIYHELGHIWHDTMRLKTREPFKNRDLWQLYREGIAMYIEQILIGNKNFYHQDKAEWLAWCQTHRKETSEGFLHRITSAESTRAFFGDWNTYKGKSDVGYYLGCEMIKDLSTRYSLVELANLKEANVIDQLQYMTE